MSEFIVSARKYRPQSFRSVVGQSHITDTLRSAIKNQTLAHAYLFTGPRGVGKTTCARILARTINCLNITEEFEACGECQACKSFDEGHSWSVHELDAASNNSVDDMRQLIEKVRIPPQVGKYSVYIIDEVHMLSASAFNAFLKTLEEPPAHAIFILATTEKHKLLPTILSRCQNYDFKRITVTDIVENLKYVADTENIKYDIESLDIIANNADGGMRDALSTFDRVVSFSPDMLTATQTAQCVGALQYNTYFDSIDFAAKESYPDILLLFDGIIRSGFEPQVYLSGLTSHLRNLVLAKSPNTLKMIEVSNELQARYVQQAAEASALWILSALDIISTAEGNYRNATNKRLLAELALIKMCELKKKASERIITDVPLPSNPAKQQSTPQPIQQPAANAPITVPQPAVAPQPVAAPQQQPTQNAQPTAPNPIQTPIQPQAQAPIQAPIQAPTPQADIATSAPPKPRERVRMTPSMETGAMPTTALSKQAQELAVKGITPETTPALTLKEAADRLQTQWTQVVAYWHSLGRPMIANALTVYNISDDVMTIIVANLTLRDEIEHNKLDIERSILDILNVRATINIIISETQQQYKPVSLEQKLQYLLGKNDKLLTLKETFDLTI